MLDAMCGHLHKVDYELRALSLLHNPFIVNIDYAFHTESLAILVLDLAVGGDLKTQLLLSPDGRMPVDQVRFYAAEIVLALSYLHSMHLIYRDLKPQNVLLHADGHVQLADLGGVMDESGCVFQRGSTRRLSVMHNTLNHVNNVRRRMSVFGTKGYVLVVFFYDTQFNLLY